MSDYPTTTPASVGSYEGGFAHTPAPSQAQHFAEQAAETPEAVRAYAEKTLAQLRESYTQARQSLEEATRALEASLEHANKGASEFNVKAMEMAQRNVNAGFEFARRLAGARSQAEAIEMQTQFMRDQLDAARAQSEEFQQLVARIATDASQPIQQQFSRSVGRYASKA